LHAVDAVDAVNEQNEDEDERNLHGVLNKASTRDRVIHTFIPYCSFAMTGLSDMKVKSLRRHVNGRGTINAMKMTISVTKRRKTWKQNKSK
jgi:hypothetical protein